MYRGVTKLNKICKNIFKCLIALVAALFISGAAFSPVNASAASYSNQMFEADGTEASVVEEKADVEEADDNTMIVMICLGGGLIIIIAVVISVVSSTVSSVASAVEDDEDE